MKKPHVLNRAMFNQGGTSAYGRGITSNLVSDEQRQRFNYGGRVGLLTGGNYGLQYGRIPPAAFEEMADITERIYTKPPVQDKWWNIYAGDEDYQYQLPEGAENAGEIVTRKTDTALEPKSDQELLDISIAKDVERDPENQVVSRSRLDRLQKEMDAGLSDDPAKEVMTDSDWMELLGPTEEQKKRTKGEAQLGIAAGALDVFSQPTIAKGMKAASPHLSKLAQTASADQKAREKAILQGKVLSKVYRDRAAAKGEADIETLKYKEGQTSTPKDIYDASLNIAYAKDQTPDDNVIASAFWNATRVKPKVLKGAKGGEKGMEADKVLIAEGDAEDLFILNGQFYEKQGQNLVKVSEEIALQKRG